MKGVKGEKAKIKLEINEDGLIVDARENDNKLKYHEDETKRMDDGNCKVVSNPCRWIKIGDVWRCV